MNSKELSEEIADSEYLYRGVVEEMWDAEHERITSAAFKDSHGVSVDRDGERTENECVKSLMKIKSFRKICRILTKTVRDNGALALYKPIPENVYHSEIHQTLDKVELSKGCARRISQAAEVLD